MSSRWLASFGLATLMVGLASAQDQAPTGEKPNLKAQVKEALEVSGEDLPKGIQILEKGLQTVPDDREALFLLGVMTTVRGEEVKDKAERVALFHQATANFARLSKLYKDLNRDEKRYRLRSLINEARALAIEGKVNPAYEAVKSAIASGFDKYEVVDTEPDLETVRNLPEFRAMVMATYKAMVAEEIAQFKTFPFSFDLKDTNDKPVKLSDFRGQVTMVDLWGTWCPSCLLEIPHFVEAYEKYKDKGLAIVGINCNEIGTPDEIKKTIKDFAREHKIEYPCLINDETTEEKVPGFSAYPTTLFLDREGKVRLVQEGYIPKAKLEVIITTLLSERARSAR